ncbi:hypothetical protein [Streptomyces sp. NPDC097619]|uniref:hypothetical protein n=1 Tax=Streptomyces sp. NPDC097619 TaxID=3157228 RepID=UPI0033193B65
MTHIAVPATARRTRLPRLALAAGALAVLTLTACGTERSGATAVVGAGSAGPARTADAQVLRDLARTCPRGPHQGPPTPAPAPGSTAPALASDPMPERADTAAPDAPQRATERELDRTDWCAMARHEERVTQALLKIEDPAPAAVRKALNGLGYPDSRIHALERSGIGTRFVLDLRLDGGRLCLEGSAAGPDSASEGCVAPAEGPFDPAARRI